MLCLYLAFDLGECMQLLDVRNHISATLISLSCDQFIVQFPLSEVTIGTETLL
jgi:hypothetical protein